VARPKNLERRRDSGAQGRAGADRTALPGDNSDQEARYIEAASTASSSPAFNLPNGNPQPGPKFEYKLDWFKRCEPMQRNF